MPRGWRGAGGALAGALLVAALGRATVGASALAPRVVASVPELEAALRAASDGDTILLRPGVYYTARAAVPAAGIQVERAVTISGACGQPDAVVIDGDAEPDAPPGHVGPGFTVRSSGVTIQCLTVRAGTLGIRSDGYDGLTVDAVRLIANGRDLNGATRGEGDGVFVRDGNNVRITRSELVGQGAYGIEGMVSAPINDRDTPTNNRQWAIQQDRFSANAYGCIYLEYVSGSTIGGLKLADGEPVADPALGNECRASGLYDDAITIEGQSVARQAPDNVVAGNIVESVSHHCFYVEGDGARVIGNACSRAGDVGVEAVGEGDLIQGNVLQHLADACIQAEGAGQIVRGNICGDVSRGYGIQLGRSIGVEVAGNTLSGVALGCVEGQGAAVEVVHNTCRDGRGEAFGVELRGDGATITGNALAHLPSSAIVYRNPAGQVTVEDNTLEYAERGPCIVVEALHAAVRGNQAAHCRGGIVLASDAPEAANNVITASGGGVGLAVSCRHCADGVVRRNRVDGVSGGFAGLALATPGGATLRGVLVEKNSVQNVQGQGVMVEGSGNTLSQNTLRNVGAADSAAALSLAGSYNDVRANAVQTSRADGIAVRGVNNLLIGNAVAESAGDGIVLRRGSSGNVVSRNRVSQNRGDGIRNDGSVTLLAHNVSRRNRRDCTGDGTSGPAGIALAPADSGNRCADGSGFAPTAAR